MSFLRNTLLVLLFATYGVLYAQETVSNHFVSCTTMLDEITVTLDFFEEFDTVSNKTTNKGYFVQTMEPLPLSGAKSKMEGEITLAGNSKQKAITLYYGSINSSSPLAAFVIDLGKRTDVQIFAKGWEKFSCIPTLTSRETNSNDLNDEANSVVHALSRSDVWDNASSSERDSNKADLYISFSVDIGSSVEGESKFTHDSSGHRGFMQNGTIPFSSQGLFRRTALGAGIQKFLGNGTHVRFEGGFRQYNDLDYGNPIYTKFDITSGYEPVTVDQVNQVATADGVFYISGGPYLGLFFDFELGDSDNFLYFGPTIGGTTVRSKYEISIGSLLVPTDFVDVVRTEFPTKSNPTTWAKASSFEVGTLLRVGKNTNLRLAYNLHKVGISEDNPFPYIQQTLISTAPLNNIHSFKIGVVYFFRR